MAGSGIRTSHDRCGGSRTQYEVCNVWSCVPYSRKPVSAQLSFRAAQCRKYDNRKVFGKVVNKWIPYELGSSNPCALVCEGEGQDIIYTFGKVTDGTHCTSKTTPQGLCVNGRCLAVSCDGHIGGTSVEDQCRVCGGFNTTCTLHKGVFHSPIPPQSMELRNSSSMMEQADQPVSTKERSGGTLGYYEVTTIPNGSTNVKITDNSHNFLGLQEGDKFLLNGDWLIDWPGDVEAAGTIFSYVRTDNDSETLSSLGPTKSELKVMVLYRSGIPIVHYEYWTPNIDKLSDSNKSSVPSNNGSKSSKQKSHDSNKRRKDSLRRRNSKHHSSFWKHSANPLSSNHHLPNRKAGPRNSSWNDIQPTYIPKNNRFSGKSTSPKFGRQENGNGLQLSRSDNSTRDYEESFRSSNYIHVKALIQESLEHGRNIPDIERDFRDNRMPAKTVKDNGPLTKAFTFRNERHPKLRAGKFSGQRFSKDKVEGSLKEKGNDLRISDTTDSLELKRTAAKNMRFMNKASYKKRKVRKKKKRSKNKFEKRCPKCKRVKKVKQHFCLSDFVSRVKIVNYEMEAPKPRNSTEVPKLERGRYEVLVEQSFKNRVPLLHKEFLWIPNASCLCPKLKVGGIYLIMGSSKLSDDGREVRLELGDKSYVRRYNNRVAKRISNLRNNEMKYCAKYRSAASQDGVVVNLDNILPQSPPNYTRYNITSPNNSTALNIDTDNIYFSQIEKKNIFEILNDKHSNMFNSTLAYESFTKEQIDSFMKLFVRDPNMKDLRRMLLKMRNDP